MKNLNPWKAVTIGIAVVITTAVVTGLVVGNWTSRNNEVTTSSLAQTEAAKPGPPTSNARGTNNTRGTIARSASTPPPVAHTAPTPPASDVEACNQSAKSAAAGTTADTTKDVLTKAVIGGALGAGVGAAGGAIAGGGGGAGKGAAIGGIVGATAGTLYGLNEANQKDARAVEAYRSCMRARGHTG